MNEDKAEIILEGFEDIDKWIKRMEEQYY